MIYCSKCGAQNEDNYFKCVKCEALLHESFGDKPYRVDEYVPDYLIWSILATLFCCLPIGIVAIVFSSQVNAKLRAGDIAGARDSSKKAKMWCLITAASFGVIMVLGIIAAIFGASFMH
jgi:uncharacterized membrane protein YvbJ